MSVSKIERKWKGGGGISAKIFLFFLISLSTCIPCATEEETSSDIKTKSANSLPRLAETFQNTLPSPFEIAQLLTQSQPPDSPVQLFRLSINKNKQSDSLSALRLGAIALHFGVINLNYNRFYVQHLIRQLQTVSHDLGVGQFVDYPAMCKCSNKRSTADSLFAIGGRNLSTITAYFQKNNRSDLNILIQMGAWMESLHLYRQLASDCKCTDLYDRLAEQKETLSQVNSLLTKIGHIPFYSNLQKKLNPLSIAFCKVSIEKNAISIIHPDRQHAYVTDHNETRVKYTNEDLNRINAAIEDLHRQIFM